MMKQTLRCIWPLNSVDPADVWEDTRSVLDRIGKLSRSLASSSIIRRVENPECEHFIVEDDRFEITFGSVANQRIDQLFVEALVDDFVDADVWIESLNQTEPLMQGFLFDVEYNHWQNAEDPLQYTAEGQEYAHLPMKSNGLPPPLEQMVIDTSDNPGRWRFRDGFVEAVTSPLWFGLGFWDRVGVDKSTVLASDLWQDVQELEGGLVRLQAHAVPFHSDEGTQADLQNRMRELIYPKEEMANQLLHRTQ